MFNELVWVKQANLSFTSDGSDGLVVHASQFKCEDPGFDPLAGRVRDMFLSSRVNSWPPFLCTAHTQICEHIKDPMDMCRKRVGLTAGGVGN